MKAVTNPNADRSDLSGFDRNPGAGAANPAVPSPPKDRQLTDSTLHVDAAPSPPAEPGATPRRTSGWLWLGIVFLPFVFAWFTLRQGHSTRDRGIAFTWLVVCMLIRAAGPAGSGAEAPQEVAQQEVEQVSTVQRSPEDTIEEYARMIEARGGICLGIAGQLRMINNNFGASHPGIADTLGKAEQYNCL
jgi:hypothetical protein